MYQYKAKIIKVYDGDTVTAEIDLGFDIKYKTSVRLIGIDTPELRSKYMLEKELAKNARGYLEDLIYEKEVTLITHKDDKYGRYLCDIYLDELNINNEMIRIGYARPYDGGKRQPWF